jgi:hypothetical protein
MTLEKSTGLWLCVVPDPPPPGQTHTSWTVVNGRLTPSPADKDQFWLGVSDQAKGQGPKIGADRVAALFTDTTTPEYPVLTRGLMESIWVAFTSGRRDRFPQVEPAHLLRFLRFHLGGIAFLRTAGPDTGGSDERYTV